MREFATAAARCGIVAGMTRPAPFEPGELLHHREWVSRLARRLCRDEHAAEDSVQTVFAHALRRPPRHRDNLRGWLAQLLRNTLSMHRRTGLRRAIREHAIAAAAPAAHVEATADAVLRTEAHRLLVDHILQLPEPQRGLVLRHYFEDVPIAELAAESDQTPDAVRAHLRRARARLRLEIERGNEGQRRGFLLLGAVGGIGKAELAVATGVVRGVMMATMLKVGVAAVVAAGALLWWSPWAHLATPQVRTNTTAESLAAMAVDGRQPPAVTAAAQPVGRQPPRQQQPSVAPALSGQLIGLLEGMPWQSRIAIRAKGMVADAWLEHEAQTDVDETGAFGFELPSWAVSAERFALKLSAAGEDPAYDCAETSFDAAALQQREPLPLAVTPIARLSGRVVDDAGKGVAAARICAYRAQDGLPQGWVVARCNTDPQGHYTLRTPIRGDLVLLAVPMEPTQISGQPFTSSDGGVVDANQPRQDLLPKAQLVRAHFAQNPPVGVFSLDRAAMIHASVVGPAGTDPADVQIRAFPLDAVCSVSLASGASPPQHRCLILLWDLYHCAAISGSGLTDLSDSGTTPTVAVPPGVRVNLWPMLRETSILQLVDQPSMVAVAPTTVQLTISGQLRTLQVRGDGRPCPAALVMGVSNGQQFVCLTDDRGQLPVLVAPQGSRLRIEARDFATMELELEAAELVPDPIVVDLKPDPTVTVVIDYQHPQVLAVRIDSRLVGQSNTHSRHLSREAATEPFRLQLAPGTYELRLIEQAIGGSPQPFLVDSQQTVRVTPEGARLAWPIVFGGRCRVDVRDNSGLLNRWRGALLDGETPVAMFAPRGGTTATSPNVKPGRYMLRITAPDGIPQFRPVEILGQQEVVIHVALR